MVGVWAMCLWEQMGRPGKVNLVELGPGRGTLMADLLRVRIILLRMDFYCIFTFFFGKSKQGTCIQLTLISKTTLSIQGASKLKDFTDSLHVHFVECSPALQKLQHSTMKCRDEDNKADGVEKSSVSTLAGTPVSWHPTLEQVPSGCAYLYSLLIPIFNRRCLVPLSVLFLFFSIYLFYKHDATEFELSNLLSHSVQRIDKLDSKNVREHLSVILGFFQ